MFQPLRLACRRILSALAILVVLPSLACAQTIISVDFCGQSKDVLGPPDTAGCDAYMAAEWNVIPGNSSDEPVALKDSSGMVTEVSLLTFSSHAKPAALGKTSTAYEKLFGASLSTDKWFPEGVKFTVGGLHRFATYDLVVYIRCESSGRLAEITTSAEGSPCYYVTGPRKLRDAQPYKEIRSLSRDHAEAGDHVIFRGLRDPELTVKYKAINGASGVTGFQIIGYEGLAETASRSTD
jgi:hypothetical protein